MKSEGFIPNDKTNLGKNRVSLKPAPPGQSSQLLGQASARCTKILNQSQGKYPKRFIARWTLQRHSLLFLISSSLSMLPLSSLNLPHSR